VARKDPEALAQLEAAAKEIHIPADTILENTSTTEGGADEVKKGARAVLAGLKPKAGGKLNPNNLIRASKNLANLLGDLVGQTKIETNKEREKGGLNAKALAALDLDDMITSLENSAKASGSANPLTLTNHPSNRYTDKALSELSALASSAPTNVPASSGPPSMLQDSIRTVVRELKARSFPDIGAANTINSDLANELQRFARADEEHRRQDMLISGRSISAHIARMTAELQQQISRCKDPFMQDKLIRHSLSLRTFSTQLKILASVKAAANYGASSNEQQLATLTTMLGRVLGDISDTLSIAKKSKRL